MHTLWMRGARIAMVIGLLWMAAPSSASAGQFALILQAGKKGHEGTSRALHAFLYAQELSEHGHEVVLIFDGAGTEWAAEFADPESQSKLKGMYQHLKESGVVEIVCDYCATAFKVKDKLTEHQAPLFSEYAGHPSIAKWADQGYQLIVL